MMDRLRNRPPLIAVLCLLIALGLHFLFLSGKIVRPPYHFLGVIPFAAGLAVMLGAVWQFEKRGTPHKPEQTPTALVAGGLYRFSRNPMYLGVVLILLGIAAFIGTLPAFLAPAAFFLAMHAAIIPAEEERLERIFGAEYRDYKRRARRWL